MGNHKLSFLLIVGLIVAVSGCAQTRPGVSQSPTGNVQPPNALPSETTSPEDAAHGYPTPNADTTQPDQGTETILTASHNSELPAKSEALPLPPAEDTSSVEQSEVLSQPDSITRHESSSAYTIEELEAIALANNPSLQQAAAVVGKARGVRTQAGLYPNPTIGYSGEEIGADGTSGKQGGFISQTIVTGGKLGLSQAVAARDIEVLIWELEAQRYRVRNAVRTQCYEVLGAKKRVEIGERLLSIATHGVEVSEALLEAQQAAKPDVLQARIQLSEVRILLQNARYDYEAAWKQLSALLGQPDLPPAAISGILASDTPLPDAEAIYNELITSSPEIQAARARVARANVQIRRQSVQPIPNLQVQLGVARDNETGDDIANAQIGIPLPLFNRNQGNAQLAIAEHRRAISDLRRLELALKNRLAAALRDYSKARNEVKRYRGEILPTAEENLKLTEEGYQHGEFDLIRVLTARRSFFETSLAYVNSQVALRQAEVAISGLLLAGGLDDVADIEGGEAVGLRDQALSGQ